SPPHGSDKLAAHPPFARAPLPRTLRRERLGLSPEGLAGPNKLAAPATPCSAVRSIPETAVLGDRPRQSSIVVRRIGCSVALADAVEASPRYSAHPRTARQGRRRNARRHSCSCPRPTNQCAIRIDKLAGRTHSKSLRPSYIRVRDRARAVSGM